MHIFFMFTVSNCVIRYRKYYANVNITARLFGKFFNIIDNIRRRARYNELSPII